MYSISEVASLTQVTSRALRHYENKGLIQPSFRSANGYRHYSEDILSKIEEIKKLKLMNFSLDEIRSFLLLKEEGLSELIQDKLKSKLNSINSQIHELEESRENIQNQLMATEKFLEGKDLDVCQRRVLMEAIKSEILENLKSRREVSKKDLEYLKREDYLFDTPEKRELIEAVKKCLEFARRENIKLGPARGSSPALLSLYALGWSQFDPSDYNLVPERFHATDYDFHIDVEFKNGQKFINYCRGVCANLKIGKIEAFKLPILDIIENVHARLDKVPDYDSISNNDPLVLDHFRKGDIEKILSFDIPQDTLVAKHFDSNYYKDGRATRMFNEYLCSQDIIDFNDVLNIEAIHRPDNLDTKPFFKEYIDRYPRAKKRRHYYDCLSSSLNEYLTPNYGVIIYQEDIIEIIREYTSWDYQKCNEFRRNLAYQRLTSEQKDELLALTGKDVFELLERETPVVFCKAHSVGAWPKLIKITAILKSLHKDIYYEEIDKWEAENGYSWGDFGFISNGVSLLQQ